MSPTVPASIRTPTRSALSALRVGKMRGSRYARDLWHTRGVIGIYPLLLIWAAVLIRRTKETRRAGWSGFAAWCLAGALFTFSLLTGFSIGLFLLPLVVAALYLAARSAPDFRAALGFVAGIGVILLILASINNFSIGWLIPGVALGAAAFASFVAEG